MLPSPPSRPSAPSSLLTGVPLDSRSASTTSLLLLYLVVTLLRSSVPCACCPTPQPLLRPGLVLIISLILCTPSVPSSTGTSERVWRRESSLRLVGSRCSGEGLRRGWSRQRRGRGRGRGRRV